MAAPALIALAHGSRDPRSAETITALVDEVRTMRPDLRIEPAFLELSKPSFAPGRRPSWSAPATTRSSSSRCCSARPTTPRSTCPPPSPRQSAKHEGLQIRATRVLGLEPAFLEVLDLRLREALKEARVRELDALVLAAAGSSDPLANQAVARLARVWGTRHKLPVTAAFASSAPPATGEAVRAFRVEGRRHIAVASLFLAPGFLPDRAAELAARGRCRRGVRSRWARTRSWPGPSWRGTPWVPSSWSPSDGASGRGRRALGALAALGRGVGRGGLGLAPSAIARSRAAIVAASTAPVGFTPSSVWNAFSASVRAGVHSPSTGPDQKPARLRVCWTAAVVATDCFSAAPPLAARSDCSAAAVALSTVPVTGSPWDSWSDSTASTVAGPYTPSTSSV